jgi:hypothetical protein
MDEITEKTKYIPRIINLRPEVYELVQEEAKRRRNGLKGFSLTLNQIVLEWADAHNVELLPVNTRELQDLPTVEKILVPAETPLENGVRAEA